MKFLIKKATGVSVSTLIALSAIEVNGMGCPFLSRKSTQSNPHRRLVSEINLIHRDGDGGVPEGGFNAVKKDIVDTVLTTPNDLWPSDFTPTNYGGLLVRLAWHCAGSYRTTDGRGGCDGARIRFDPERSWEDNGSLDKALELLKPVKKKYGEKLSWGDLIILAGTTAIESMGGPILGFCGGRIDNSDGSESLILGPSDIQEEISPCRSLNKDGLCNRVALSPMGPTTLELIYVNPNGVVGHVGDPEESAKDIRHTFERMDMNDTETVALIGGGHAFGKCHAYTSGFNGPWTSRPTEWDNEYFTSLLEYNWTLGDVPNTEHEGLKQWSTVSNPYVIMLTADIAMTKGVYLDITKQYAENSADLDYDFKHAWYKLTTRDMGPASRCIGELVPPVQDFQNPLPEATSQIIDYVPVRSQIQEVLKWDNNKAGAFVNLAYQCASTFRITDYSGGCNGARIRFSPEADWIDNKGTSEALAALAPIKTSFPQVSMSDLIVLAGQTAVEDAGLNKMAFCGGRVDGIDGSGSELLAPREYNNTLVAVKDDMVVKGFTPREWVALSARSALSNQFYKDLLENKGTFSPKELALIDDVEFSVFVKEFANDSESFKEVFAQAWTKMMNADRFKGPRHNICDGKEDLTEVQSTNTSGATMISTVLSVVASVLTVYMFM